MWPRLARLDSSKILCPRCKDVRGAAKPNIAIMRIQLCPNTPAYLFCGDCAIRVITTFAQGIDNAG
jgi:hypothetical protein